MSSPYEFSDTAPPSEPAAAASSYLPSHAPMASIPPSSHSHMVLPHPRPSHPLPPVEDDIHDQVARVESQLIQIGVERTRGEIESTVRKWPTNIDAIIDHLTSDEFTGDVDMASPDIQDMPPPAASSSSHAAGVASSSGVLCPSGAARSVTIPVLAAAASRVQEEDLRIREEEEFERALALSLEDQGGAGRASSASATGFIYRSNNDHTSASASPAAAAGSSSYAAPAASFTSWKDIVAEVDGEFQTGSPASSPAAASFSLPSTTAKPAAYVPPGKKYDNPLFVKSTGPQHSSSSVLPPEAYYSSHNHDEKRVLQSKKVNVLNAAPSHATLTAPPPTKPKETAMGLMSLIADQQVQATEIKKNSIIDDTGVSSVYVASVDDVATGVNDLGNAYAGLHHPHASTTFIAHAAKPKERSSKKRPHSPATDTHMDERARLIEAARIAKHQKQAHANTPYPLSNNHASPASSLPVEPAAKKPKLSAAAHHSSNHTSPSASSSTSPATASNEKKRKSTDTPIDKATPEDQQTKRARTASPIIPPASAAGSPAASSLSSSATPSPRLPLASTSPTITGHRVALPSQLPPPAPISLISPSPPPFIAPLQQNGNAAGTLNHPSSTNSPSPRRFPLISMNSPTRLPPLIKLEPGNHNLPRQQESAKFNPPVPVASASTPSASFDDGDDDCMILSVSHSQADADAFASSQQESVVVNGDGEHKESESSDGAGDDEEDEEGEDDDSDATPDANDTPPPSKKPLEIVDLDGDIEMIDANSSVSNLPASSSSATAAGSASAFSSNLIRGVRTLSGGSSAGVELDMVYSSDDETSAKAPSRSSSMRMNAHPVPSNSPMNASSSVNPAAVAAAAAAASAVSSTTATLLSSPPIRRHGGLSRLSLTPFCPLLGQYDNVIQPGQKCGMLRQRKDVDKAPLASLLLRQKEIFNELLEADQRLQDLDHLPDGPEVQKQQGKLNARTDKLNKEDDWIDEELEARLRAGKKWKAARKVFRAWQRENDRQQREEEAAKEIDSASPPIVSTPESAAALSAQHDAAKAAIDSHALPANVDSSVFTAAESDEDDEEEEVDQNDGSDDSDEDSSDGDSDDYDDEEASEVNEQSPSQSPMPNSLPIAQPDPELLSGFQGHRHLEVKLTQLHEKWTKLSGGTFDPAEAERRYQDSTAMFDDAEEDGFTVQSSARPAARPTAPSPAVTNPPSVLHLPSAALPTHATAASSSASLVSVQPSGTSAVVTPTMATLLSSVHVPVVQKKKKDQTNVTPTHATRTVSPPTNVSASASQSNADLPALTPVISASSSSSSHHIPAAASRSQPRMPALVPYAKIEPGTSVPTLPSLPGHAADSSRPRPNPKDDVIDLCDDD